ncbi:MAG: sulfatase-like hydrolase/transferase, partial [Deltaproteobacteria bacterium]|nr:sulfatase-like hydrolase/transferase [Deltaproteobacteria bacterium]
MAERGDRVRDLRTSRRLGRGDAQRSRRGPRHDGRRSRPPGGPGRALRGCSPDFRLGRVQDARWRPAGEPGLRGPIPARDALPRGEAAGRLVDLSRGAALAPAVHRVGERAGARGVRPDCDGAARAVPLGAGHRSCLQAGRAAGPLPAAKGRLALGRPDTSRTPAFTRIGSELGLRSVALVALALIVATLVACERAGSGPQDAGAGSAETRRAAAEPTPRPRIIILLSIDTLRADHLGAYGHERFTSPQLDALAAQGVLFEDASSTAPWTLPAHASMLTGLHPGAHGVRTQ